MVNVSNHSDDVAWRTGWYEQLVPQVQLEEEPEHAQSPFILMVVWVVWFDVWVGCRVLFVQRLVMDVAIVEDDDKRRREVRWGARSDFISKRSLSTTDPLPKRTKIRDVSKAANDKTPLVYFGRPSTPPENSCEICAGCILMTHLAHHRDPWFLGLEGLIGRWRGTARL